MPTDTETTSPPSVAQDDLRTIKGIGSKTAEAFYASGFRRFTDLAESSPEVLAQALFTGGGLKISPERIAASGWIELAREAAQQQNSEVISATTAGQVIDTLSHNKEWPEHACFFLFFDYKVDENGKESWQTRIWRTRVYHHKTGEEKIIPDIEPHLWVPWIIEQAHLPLDSETVFSAPNAPKTSEPEMASPTKLTILDVQVAAQEQPESKAKKLSAEIHFVLAQSYAEFAIPESTPYQILLLLINQERHQTNLITSEHGLFYPDEPVHIHRLEFPIPDLGRYTLQTFVVVRAETEYVALYRGPTINVIP